jgi:hypothetical protein
VFLGEGRRAELVAVSSEGGGHGSLEPAGCLVTIVGWMPAALPRGRGRPGIGSRGRARRLGRTILPIEHGTLRRAISRLGDAYVVAPPGREATVTSLSVVTPDEVTGWQVSPMASLLPFDVLVRRAWVVERARGQATTL